MSKPASPLDVVSRLLPLTWRGIEVPSVTMELSFAHRLIEHKQHGVAGAHVENTGRDAAKFSFRIPFHTSVGDYPDLYPTRFRDFLNAFLDPSVGELIHPEMGSLDARPATFTLHCEANKRSGYDVDVTWVETIEGDMSLEFGANSPIDEAITLSQKLDEAKAKIEIPEDPYDDGSGLSLSESLRAIKGQMMLAQLSLSSIEASIANTVNAVNDLIGYVSSLTDPGTWPVIDYAKQIEASLNTTLETLPGLKKAKKVDLRISPAQEPMGDSAARYGMGLEDFVLLNPRYASSGMVPSGAEIWIYVES